MIPRHILQGKNFVALLQLGYSKNLLKRCIRCKQGKTINQVDRALESEHRAVMHMAMRDFFDHREETLKARAIELI